MSKISVKSVKQVFDESLKDEFIKNNFTINLVDNQLTPNADYIASRNRTLKKPFQAYDHLVSTTVNTIRFVISYVLNTTPKCSNEVEYYQQIKKIRCMFINDIVEKNSYTKTLNIPKFDTYNSKLKESRYYQYAKETFRKVTSGETPILDLNGDAMLAFYLYELSNKVIYSAFVVNDKKLEVNEKCPLVEDYRKYNEEIYNSMLNYVNENNKASDKAEETKVAPQNDENTNIIPNNSNPDDDDIM